MKRSRPLKLSFEYMDTPERRVLSLERDGISCMPVIGFDCYRKKWSQAPLHVHDECIEVSLCLRGDLEFETKDKSFPFKPGFMFISGPNDVHRIKEYPKGMSKYWFLFRIPNKGIPILGLPLKEEKVLIDSLTNISKRIFSDAGEVKRLFKKLFLQYDTLPQGTAERSLRLRSTVLALLLAVVDAATVRFQGRKDMRLMQLVENMRVHPENDYPIDMIAANMGLSTCNLLARFKHLTGMPPHSFVLAQRITKAKEMLSSGIPVGVVAHKLGFSSSQHFSNFFKMSEGVSPRRWK